MKLNKLLIIAIAALFFSACTTEEDGSFTRHELVFQVCMGNNETRAITDNSWSEGDFIFVKVGEDVKQYKITFDENSIPIAEGVDADNTFFWEDLAGSSVTVTAWSFGKKYVDSLKGTITLESDQSNEEDFYNSDFLYAPSATIKKADVSQLTFYHQMARVNINIKCDEKAEISSVELGTLENSSPCLLQATFTEPTASTDEESDPNHGVFDIVFDDGEGDGEEERVPVIPCQVSTVSNFDASYAVILIPFPIESFGISITLSDGSKYSYVGGIYESPNDNIYPFDPGTVNTFNITIRNKELTVDGFVDASGLPLDPVSVNDWSRHQ